MRKSKEYPRLKLVELYNGEDSRWAGWHNLLLQLDSNTTPGNHKVIAGPLDPETSKELKEATCIPGH